MSSIWGTFQFKGVAQLVKRWFGQEVRIISVCEQELGEKLIEWLFANVFFRRTGLNWTLREVLRYVRFCEAYADKALLAQGFRLTHFVDDRPEVLIPMKGIVRHRFLFNPERDVLAKFQDQLEGITIVWNWKELVAAIGATMPDGCRRARDRQRKKIVPKRHRAH